MAVPPERLLIETDAPAIPPPREYRAFDILSPDGKEWNHPANLVPIISGVAGLLGEDESALRERLWENTRRFLGSVWHD
jgi:TatD DNase family protein